MPAAPRSTNILASLMFAVMPPWLDNYFFEMSVINRLDSRKGSPSISIGNDGTQKVDDGQFLALCDGQSEALFTLLSVMEALSQK
jgi:hypothetical protein